MKGSVALSELNRRVMIESPVFSQDDMGGKVVSWETVATVWAKVNLLTGREGDINFRREGRQKLEITMRHQPDLGTQYRLIYGGEALDILSVDQERRDEGFTHIVAEKRINKP